jgi:hypothetical protein
MAELYLVCDSCLGLYAADDEEDSESEPFQEGSGDGSDGEEDLGEVEDLEDAKGDEGVDYDSEPFQEGPEGEYSEGEVDYDSELYREGSGVEEEPEPYLEGSEVEQAEDIEGVEYAYNSDQYLEGLEVDEEADEADYVDYDYDYDSEPVREGYGDREEDGD